MMNPAMFAAPAPSRRQARKGMRRQMRRQARYMRGGYAPVRWFKALLVKLFRLALAVVIVGVALAVMTHRAQGTTDHAPAGPSVPVATHTATTKHGGHA